MTPPVTGPHRAHHSKSAVALGIAVVLVAACGRPTVPRPEPAPARTADYVPVPYPPPPPAVEIVPAPPRPDAVWADGTWEWTGRRYRWQPGAWVLTPSTPEGPARRARWVVVRRAEDGQLFFATAAWHAPDGEPVADPTPLVRARSRATEEDTETTP